MIYKTRGRGGGLFFRAQRRRDDGRRGISMREFYATLAVVQKSVHVCVCVCVCVVICDLSLILIGARESEVTKWNCNGGRMSMGLFGSWMDSFFLYGEIIL